MNRRDFLATTGLAAVSVSGARMSFTSPPWMSRRLRSVGVQLYSFRDDARRDLERTLDAIAAIGYREVELLGSFSNFGMAPARLRSILDRLGLRATSTHVAGEALDDLPRTLGEAETLGHRYVVVASLPIQGTPTLDEYRRWADRLNEAGRNARARNIWIGFHNHADDLAPVEGAVPYELLVERTDPSVVRHQLDTGNAAMAGRDPLDLLTRYRERYWLFHIKDVPQLRSTNDTELGRGIIDFQRILAGIPAIDEKHLFVEQETYPGTPTDSLRRDFEFISRLEF